MVFFFEYAMPGKTSSIGLFDSGVGGFTVANAIRQIMPGEDMIYFGDTAHLPYGDKSKDTIIQYSLDITKFLLSRDCKVILIACNSASSNAYREVMEYAGDKAIVMNVIDPVVEELASDPLMKHVGVIGTKATIGSGTYETKLKNLNSFLEVSSMATPLFVPMIEEGFIFDDISNAIIRSYLSKDELKEIDTLILGCTHYPIIKNQISRFFNFEVNVIDTGMMVAERLRNILIEKDLMNDSRKAGYSFFVSDHTPYFEVIARMFFGEKIALQKVSL